jgi:KipI family sensor histidine kinase inhibitor
MSENGEQSEGDVAILPLGDRAVLVRFAQALSEDANRRAISFAARLTDDTPEGVEEVAPGLVSVLVRTRPGVDFWRLSGELRLRLGDGPSALGRRHEIAIRFDGEDLGDVAALTGMPVEAFVERHNARELRVLATGFAPGFVYCGFHDEALVVPRREQVRPVVPAGTVIFAAGQTAIAATPIRTGWHVIGRTEFRNFDPARTPPTALSAGDTVRFASDA